MDRKPSAKEPASQKPSHGDTCTLEDFIAMMSVFASVVQEWSYDLEEMMTNTHRCFSDDGNAEVTGRPQEVNHVVASQDVLTPLEDLRFNVPELRPFANNSSFNTFQSLLHALLLSRHEYHKTGPRVSDVALLQIGRQVLQDIAGVSSQGGNLLRTFSIAVADILREHYREQGEHLPNVVAFLPEEKLEEISRNIPSDCSDLSNCPPTEPISEDENQSLSRLTRALSPALPPPLPPSAAAARTTALCPRAPRMAEPFKDTRKEPSNIKKKLLKTIKRGVHPRFLRTLIPTDFRRMAKAQENGSRRQKLLNQLAYAIEKAHERQRIIPTKAPRKRKSNDADEAVGYICKACDVPLQGHVCPFEPIEIPEELWEEVRQALTRRMQEELDEWRAEQDRIGRTKKDRDEDLGG